MFLPFLKLKRNKSHRIEITYIVYGIEIDSCIQK